MVPKIHVLCGMIASGKSTYARNAARQGILTLNDDAIVNLLHGDDYTLYNKELKILYKTIENQIVGTVLAMNKVILVDRGMNVSVQARNRWLALAKSFDVPCEAIIFKNDGPEIHASRRTDSDARGHDYAYWHGVAKFHNTNYVEPAIEEGFDAIYRISFDEIKQGKVIF
jgi:predicted kinase